MMGCLVVVSFCFGFRETKFVESNMPIFHTCLFLYPSHFSIGLPAHFLHISMLFISLGPKDTGQCIFRNVLCDNYEIFEFLELLILYNLLGRVGGHGKWSLESD